ncbi:hypothetical protein FBF25_00025 [Candidatus Saccharibacteria bacterium oral taxon 488]|jgi:hypothetical protein|nr:hypothetical protein FBF25_00025 [Candidatus Saccharibacteria bacterium oral taxon 488]QLF51465.1 hypothetical protein HW277_00025 [Candidatus Saccharibacteria bacterium oral taxon 488]
MTSRNKLITISIIILICTTTITCLHILIFRGQPDKTAVNIEKSGVNLEMLKTSVNKAIRDNNYNIRSSDQDRPIYTEPNSIRYYSNDWFTATITFLDEDPYSDGRRFFCIFKASSSSYTLKLIAQPDRAIGRDMLPSDVPSDLAKEFPE